MVRIDQKRNIEKRKKFESQFKSFALITNIDQLTDNTMLFLIQPPPTLTTPCFFFFMYLFYSATVTNFHDFLFGIFLRFSFYFCFFSLK